MSQAMTQPITLPTELLAYIIKLMILGGSRLPNLPMNVMLTCHRFLKLSQPLYYRSMILPNPETWARFAGALIRCIESKSTNGGPHPDFVQHLRFDYLPMSTFWASSSNLALECAAINQMSCLRTITTDFMDDCRLFNATTFSQMISRPPSSLETVRFISLKVFSTSVSLMPSKCGRH